MRLELSEATAADFDRAKTINGPKDHVMAPLVPSCIELTEANAKELAEWSAQQQKDFLGNDPTVRMVKVVDADNNNEIVALGRWHRYPNGYEQYGDLEYAGLKPKNDPASYPEGFHVPFYVGFLDDAIPERKKWQDPGLCWILTTLTTREPMRKNGAGSLILKWGLEQAQKDNAPAYLEAAADAVNLYKEHGFREVEEMTMDLTPYGMDGVKFTLLNMRADPK